MATVEITQQMIQRCYNFSTQIIRTNDQYNRIKDSDSKRIERTFVGKLAELSFLELLRQNQIDYPEGDMFTIYEGQTNVDDFDFITVNGLTVDIKSASKPYHQRIMIPIDQFNNMPKNLYVGVKLNGSVENDKIILQSITRATIHGYCSYEELEQMPTENYGYADCKAMNLRNLDPIEELLEQF